MRLQLLALLTALAVAGPAEAAAPSPHIKTGTPYAAARAQLAKQGFVPARIVRNGASCGDGDHDPCATEKIFCGGSRDWCTWLYVRRADEALFVLETRAEGWGAFDAQPGPSLARADEFRSARKDDLDDLVIVTPRGRRISFESPRPKYVEPPMPLCSANGGQIPCWAKPPPGYRPPR